MEINQRNAEGNREGYWEGYWGNGQLSYKGHYRNDEHIGYWVFQNRMGELTLIEYHLVD
jgi:hypothetical protein